MTSCIVKINLPCVKFTKSSFSFATDQFKFFTNVKGTNLNYEKRNFSKLFDKKKFEKSYHEPRVGSSVGQSSSMSRTRRRDSRYERSVSAFSCKRKSI